MPLPYNVMLGRTGMRSIRVVGSTIHLMIKFLTVNGVATLKTSREALWEFRQIEEMQSSWKETQSSHSDQWQAVNRLKTRINKSPLKEQGCVHREDDGAKNFEAVLQRMMDKVFAKQRGQNVEVCLEEIVIKIKTELDLVRDLEETLHKLQRVNPAAARVGNLLHFNGESSADTNPHGKILKNNLPDIQSQRGNRCPYRRDVKSFRREAKGKIVKKFFGQGEQVLQAPGKEYSHDVRLNFYASEDNMDYEALLVGLVAFAGRNIKDIHVFIGSKLLVDQVEGSRVPRMKEAKRYMEEIMDATTPFHRFRITYLPNVLNPKAEALTGLASIRLELLNQEVSVGVKTRPSVEAQDKLQEKERNTSMKPAS
ncbi:reverse transcriptase domain-containing protein [Tanacetum coccineum]